MAIRVDRKAVEHLLTPEQLAEPEPKGRNKYGAVPTAYNGVRYDSKAEAEQADALDSDLRRNKLRWWLRQVPVRISGPEDKVVETTRIDFLVCEAGRPGKPDAVYGIEVKGRETPGWRKVRKRWLAYGPFPLAVVKNGRIVEVLIATPEGGL